MSDAAAHPSLSTLEPRSVGAARLLALGDLHGEFDKWMALMRRLELVDLEGHWTGGQDTLVLVGDYVDRGRQGLMLLQAVRRLQAEAARAGGRLVALLGNHDAIMIANARGRDGSFPPELGDIPYDEILGNHYINGGLPDEVAALSRDRDLLEWYAHLPMIHLEQGVLFLHGNLDYTPFGGNVEEVNALFAELLETAQGGLQVFALLTVRHWAVDGSPDDEQAPPFLYSPLEAVQVQLEHFGAERLVHGHTPENVTVQRPFQYAAGRAYNIDHALCYHPDLRGYALELLPDYSVHYHLAEAHPMEELQQLRERQRHERSPLKRVLLRDQIGLHERQLSLPPTPLSLEDLMDLDRALEELTMMQRVTDDPEVREALTSLFEQLHRLQHEWGLHTAIRPGDVV